MVVAVKLAGRIAAGAALVAAMLTAERARAQSLGADVDAGMATIDGGTPALEGDVSAIDGGTPALGGGVPAFDAGAFPDGGVSRDPGVSARWDSPVAGEAVVDVTVRARPNEVRRLRRSADAVAVIDLTQSQKRAADMGEVLSRVEGVSLRRAGGLGSATRFSLNGLYDEQIRFMLDGVPLEYAGFPFGIANSPVNLVERIEVYRGVVPIRLGSDALGGAVNLVIDPRREARAKASYELGSFGLHRVTADGRYRHEPSGFIAGISGFIDAARNDYEVRVEDTDDSGQLSPIEVKRKHDAYRAFGAIAEVGVADKPWARTLLLRGFVSGYDKELQHNVPMTVPYGEVSYGERAEGVTVSYQHAPLAKLDVDLLANYSHRTIDFRDESRWVYNWRNERVRLRTDGPGEIDETSNDATLWQHSGFARAVLGYELASGHTLRASLTPNYTTRTGTERVRAPDSRDPLSAEQWLLSLITGVEYEQALWPLPDSSGSAAADSQRLKNSLFAKSYVYRAHTAQWLESGILRQRDSASDSFGIGDALRVAVTRELALKLSYEYTTRLPRPDEVFGNGVLIIGNPTLYPERSHNGNFGPRYELRRAPIGDLVLDVNTFVRVSDDLILLLGNDRSFFYANVFSARALGLEGQLQWFSPGKYVMVELTPSWVEHRNTARQGVYAAFEGDRLPNKPYLFGSWTAQLRFARLLHRGDVLEPFYEGRWVHEFYRGWESQGLRTFKQVVDRQLSHDVGFVYSLQTESARASLSFEVANVGDARVYDFYGVQRPGRGYYLKLTGSL